jgi:hypothetical protein
MVEEIFRLFSSGSAVRSIELTGSRSRGDPTQLSDWDFLVGTDDFDGLANQLPDIVAPLRPLAQQWDRLSDHKCYMLVLRGPHKIDFLLPGIPSRRGPPWQVGRETLGGMDSHFWDWVLWLGSKQLRGERRLIQRELRRMSDHLLGPMGAGSVPTSIATAISAYTSLRSTWEVKLGVNVRHELQDDVEDGLRRAGVV